MTIRNIATTSSIQILFAFAIVIAGTVPGVRADAATRALDLGWQPVAGANVAGYTIHVSTEAGEMLDAIDVGMPAEESGVMRATIELDVDVEHRVAIATYDENGFVSALSPELTIPSGTPLGSLHDEAEQLVIQRLLELRFDFGESRGNPAFDARYEDMRFVQASLENGTRALSCDFYGSGKKGIMLSRLFENDPDISDNLPQGLLFGLEKPEASEHVIIRHAMAGWNSPRGANQDSRPACGDLDGDGMAELVVGFGAEGSNMIQVFDDIASHFGEYESGGGQVVGLRQIAPEILQQGGNGATRPAIGDIDGDGLGEVVIAFEGEAGCTQLKILDDTEHSFAPHSSPSLSNGLLDIKSPRIPVDFGGLVLPLLFDLDGDGRDEIIVAYAQESELILQIFDDAQAGFAVLH